MTLVVYIYIICGYQTSRHQAIWHKILLGNRLHCLVDVVYQCIVVLSVTFALFSGGPGVNPSSWGWLNKNHWSLWLRKGLKKCWMRPHVSTMDNICDPVVLICAQLLWENHSLLWETHGILTIIPAGCVMCALQSEGKIILIYSYFEIRVYFHPCYDMTLGFKPLGLVVALF